MYRKFTADHFFTGHEMLAGPVVLITDMSGTIIEIADYKDAGDNVEVFKGLLTPGFVNAHCHLELSHLKGSISEKTGLVDFVQQVMGGRAASAEIKSAAMIAAEAEMYATGIVAVGDICNTADSIPVKQKSRLQWHNFIEVSGFTDAAAQKRLDHIKNVYQQFRQTDELKNTTLSPHAPYSVSEKLFRLLNDETSNQLITIHNQESEAENELYRYNKGGFLSLYKNFGIDNSSFTPTGKSSFQSWLTYFTKQQSIISVHNTYLSEADLVFLNNWQEGKTGNFYYCLCINANKYIEQQIPPVSLLQRHNAAIIIGTDSYASNHHLDILAEIKSIQQETGYTVPLTEILKWATINGAKALQLADTIGSFEKGKTPGVVLVQNLENLQTTQYSFAERIL